MIEEKVLLNATVCIPIKDNKVLLGIKTRKIGAGYWNGYGGGVEKGETIAQTAVRELKEEVGLIAKTEDLDKIAIMEFHNTKSNNESFICKVHMFLINKWEGAPIETSEMTKPTFFKKDNLPLDNMMPADKYYFPLIVNGIKIIGKAKYGPNQKELLEEVIINKVTHFNE